MGDFGHTSANRVVWSSEFSVHHWVSGLRAVPPAFRFRLPFLERFITPSKCFLPTKISHCQTSSLTACKPQRFRVPQLWDIKQRGGGVCPVVLLSLCSWGYFFLVIYSSHFKMLSPLSWNDCQIQCGLTKLLSWKKPSGLYSQSWEEDSHFLFTHKGCGSPGFNFLMCLGELEPASLISQENTIRLCCAAY